MLDWKIIVSKQPCNLKFKQMILFGLEIKHCFGQIHHTDTTTLLNSGAFL